MTTLFTTLDKIDKHLEGRDYLVGNQLTEADIRLIPALLRFDLVYFTHFKCNLKQIKDQDYKKLDKKLVEIFISNLNE